MQGLQNPLVRSGLWLPDHWDFEGHGLELTTSESLSPCAWTSLMDQWGPHIQVATVWQDVELGTEFRSSHGNARVSGGVGDQMQSLSKDFYYGEGVNAT